MPGIVLATGFFLLLSDTIGLPQSPYALVILTNALMAVPYALKVLENPMRDLAERYNPLCLSLDIHGWQRLADRTACAASPAGTGTGLRLRAVDRRFRRGRLATSISVPCLYLYQQIPTRNDGR